MIGTTRTDDDKNLAKRLAEWREEQHRIASSVIVLEEENEEHNFQIRAITKKSQDSSTTPPHFYYGGVDITFPDPNSKNYNGTEQEAFAVYSILSSINHEIVYLDSMSFIPSPDTPYISSYLSFREIGPLQHLVEKQMSENPEYEPFVILVDGNGILHERMAGIACFLGVRTGLRTIGVGKTLYCWDGLNKEVVRRGLENGLKEFCRDVVRNKEKEEEEWKLVVHKRCIIDADDREQDENIDSSSTTELSLEEMLSTLSSNYYDGFALQMRGASGKVWGAALVGHGGKMGRRDDKRRGCGTKNPIFISVGHNISLTQSVEICCMLSRARVPEPVRVADLEGRRLLREAQQASERVQNKSS